LPDPCGNYSQRKFFKLSVQERKYSNGRSFLKKPNTRFYQQSKVTCQIKSHQISSGSEGSKDHELEKKIIKFSSGSEGSKDHELEKKIIKFSSGSEGSKDHELEKKIIKFSSGSEG